MKRILQAAFLPLLAAAAALAADPAPPDAPEPYDLNQLTDALLRRDPAAAAPHFDFPVTVHGSGPDLTEENFEELFPVVFDDSFHAVFDPAARALGTNLWTEYPKGTGAPPGLWCTGGSRVSRVTFVSDSRRAAKKNLRFPDFDGLPRPFYAPIAALRFAFETDDGTWRGRLDDLTDGSHRLSLWRKGRSLAAIPDFSATCLPSVPDPDASPSLWTPAAPSANALFAGLRAPPVPRNPDPYDLADPGTPLELLLRTDPASPAVSAHPARARVWHNLLAGQSASEPTVFSHSPVPENELVALHSSLKRLPFENVFCFEADDGSFAGRVDFLPSLRLAPAHEPSPPDDDLALFRVAVYTAPVRGWQKPEFVFFATQRMEGSSGTHTYVDVSWGRSLGVDVAGAKADGGCEFASLDLVSWSVDSPELGWTDWKATMHLARWSDILRTPAPPPGTKPPWR